jgi:hypothetical protein
MPTVFQNRTIELAVELQKRSKAKFDHQPDDLVRTALFVLIHDAVTIHRAVGVLAEAGWPAPAAVLLRTLVDIGVSAMAIVNSATPPMAAFRYFYAGFRRHARDQNLPSAVRRQMFDQIRQRLAILPPSLRKEAIAVIKEKDRPYWFGQEFATPSVVLERFSSTDMVWVYAQLSGVAHGSFLGLRLYRENPDAISVNPESLGTRAFAADLTSSRLLVDLCGLRNEVEGLDYGPDIDRLRDEILVAAKELPAFAKT